MSASADKVAKLVASYPLTGAFFDLAEDASPTEMAARAEQLVDDCRAALTHPGVTVRVHDPEIDDRDRGHVVVAVSAPVRDDRDFDRLLAAMYDLSDHEWLGSIDEPRGRIDDPFTQDAGSGQRDGRWLSGDPDDPASTSGFLVRRDGRTVARGQHGISRDRSTGGWANDGYTVASLCADVADGNALYAEGLHGWQAAGHTGLTLDEAREVWQRRDAITDLVELHGEAGPNRLQFAFTNGRLRVCDYDYEDWAASLR